MKRDVIRVHPLLERLFPSVVWGDPDRVSGPVYLTFDDGPDPNVTPAVLDCLEKHEVHAAFFVVGDNLTDNSHLLERIRNAGHLLGYHGRTHETWWFKTGRKRLEEMNPGFIPNIDPVWFFHDSRLILRPPYGRLDPYVVRYTKKLNGIIVQFRLVIGDWLPGKTAETLRNHLLEAIRPGDIVVLHDECRNSHLLPEILDEVIPKWRDNGLTIGNLKNLLKGRTP